MKKEIGALLLKNTLRILFAVLALFPFLWLLSTSFKNTGEIFEYPPAFLPSSLSLENYIDVFTAVPFPVYFLNSLIVVVVSVSANLLIASAAGFALARLHFRGKGLFFVLVLAAMLIPKEMIVIPLFTVILGFGLADTLTGVILPFAVEGIAVFLMRQSFLAIPKEIEDAALIDGCTPFKLWLQVMLPMTKPTLAALAIFTFIGTWGDFLWPLIVLSSSENFTLQVGLSQMLGTFINNYRMVAAGSMLALIPVFFVFIFAQKYFEKGIIAGSGK